MTSVQRTPRLRGQAPTRRRGPAGRRRRPARRPAARRPAPRGCGRDEQPLDRLGPRVRGQHERAPVDRHSSPPRSSRRGLDGLLGVEVDVAPRRVVGPDGHERHVERPVLGTEPGVPVEEAGVAAEEDLAGRARRGPTRPRACRRGAGPRPEKCWASTAVTRTPPTSWPSSQSHSTTRSAGTPHASRCAPTPSGTRNTASVRSTSCADGVHVEVVVVVVRDDDGVDPAQARRAAPARRAAAAARRAGSASSARSTRGRRAAARRRARRGTTRGRTS